MYHAPKPPKPPPWWAEVFILTKAVLGILFWPLAALLLLIGAIVGLVVLLTIHWAFGVLLVAFLAAGVTAFALWEMQRPSPL